MIDLIYDQILITLIYCQDDGRYARFSLGGWWCLRWYVSILCFLDLLSAQTLDYEAGDQLSDESCFLWAVIRRCA